METSYNFIIPTLKTIIILIMVTEPVSILSLDGRSVVNHLNLHVNPSPAPAAKGWQVCWKTSIIPKILDAHADFETGIIRMSSRVFPQTLTEKSIYVSLKK